MTSRICVVAPEFVGPFPNGGVGTACYWEATILGRAGYDVTVLYTGSTERETPEHWERHFADTAPFRYVDLGRHTDASDLERLARYEYTSSEARTSELVLAWLRRQRFDLVLFQEFLGHGARALQARRAGCALDGTRVVTTMHSCRQWIYEGMQRLPGGPHDVAVDFLEKESTRGVDWVIAPSHHMAAWAQTHWRLATQPAVLPYCYDDALALPPGRVEHAGPFRHLVFFGRLETRKGLHLFCRALVSHPELRASIDQVTFLGKPSSVEGLPSEAFIAREMAKIPGLPWTMKGDLGSLEAQSWLSAQSGVLVVAPSLVDNLPYAVIELFSRRIPFVSTRIGGIPEIVGASNRHVLADPTAASLAAVIGRVHARGRLAMNYGDGYNVAVANDTHVAFVQELLATPPGVQPRHDGAFDVVVIGAADDNALARARLRLGAGDRDLLRGRWMGVDDWGARNTETPAIFMHADVTPAAGCASTLLSAIAQPGVSMATSYFTLDDSAGPFDAGRVVTPLGGALEAGWRQNVFGGPCFAATPAAFEALRSLRAGFEFWPGYAAVVCRGLTLAVVPTSLYQAGPATRQARTHAELESVLSEFHSSRPSALDLGWLLKSALGTGPTTDVGRALYDRFVTMPDDLIGAYAGLTADEAQNPFIRDFATVRQTLNAAVTRWRETDPRVWIYGTGQHAKMMLSVCPELGAFVAGFIDRRPMGRFLGKPCVTPDVFKGAEADAIVYSSREFEHEMYARMKDANVEHVLLYRESPAEPEANTSTRLRRRFGHAGADIAALRAMYQVPKWATGYVSTSDATFLAEIIAALAPRTVVELGVAAGASSAAILHSLDRLPEPDQRTLYSCDVRPTCYFNEAFETGQACREMYPDPRARWQRDWTMDARRLRARLPEGSVDLTFIDANHAHPWPLLDLLHATEFARPGSWIVLHDIELPIQHPAYQIYGPRWLFQAWPFNKVKGVGLWTSIGAVQLPDEPSELASMAIALMEKPWEHTPSEPHLRLPARLADVQEAFSARLRRASGALVA